MKSILFAGICLCVLATACHAASGTSTIATPGSAVPVEGNWPAGLAELINHPLRTNGWNPWFTEWPNDVNQYEIKAANMDDVNQLVQKLADIKCPLKQVRLSYAAEPDVIGWTTRLDQGNKVPVILSIGDQPSIDQWFVRTGNKFGQIEFAKAPEAVPPTLTIFVGNSIINLDELVIPEGVEVIEGNVPTTFHRMNTVKEVAANAKAQQPGAKIEAYSPPLPEDANLRAVAERIRTFLEQRERD